MPGMAEPRVERVSVIVPTRDRTALLQESLASIRRLEGPDLHLEIIVCDNGSDSETPRVAEQFHARYLRSERAGMSIARNVAMQAATGDYLAFLDDDDVWLPTHLRPHLRLLAQQPELIGVVGQIINTNLDLQSMGDPWPVDAPRNGELFDALLEYMPQLGATVVRASARQIIGYFDESLAGDEDWDWHLRLAAAGRVGFVQIPCMLFRQRPPGDADDMQHQRMPFTRKVFLRNVRRGRRRPQDRVRLLRVYLRHAGCWCGHFLTSATAHVQRNEWSAARRALLWAVEASPAHALWAVVHDARMRRTVLMAIGHH